MSFATIQREKPRSLPYYCQRTAQPAEFVLPALCKEGR